MTMLPTARSRRLVPAAVLLALALSAGAAAAKEGAEAQLDTPIDLGAEPGTLIDVSWNVVRLDGEHRRPMTGLPIFLRLVPPAAGGPSVSAMGTEPRAGSGHYVATIEVPAGGIASIEVGQRAAGCIDGACQTFDVLFPLTDDALVTGMPPDDPAASPAWAPAQGTADLVWLMAIGVAAALAGGVAARLVGRRSVGQRV